MKAVLISIQPKWIEKIANGEKTIKVCKTRPKLETPFKCYIYCTYGNPKDNYCLGKRGEVIGEFVCDRIYEWTYNYNVGEYNIGGDSLCRTCLSYSEFENYGKGKTVYGWHISNLVIYDKPKELSEFKHWKNYNMGSWVLSNLEEVTRPPQSWCYVEKGE